MISILDYAAIFSILIPALCAVVYYKSFPFPLKLLTVVLVFASSVDLWCTYASWYKIRTYPVQNFYGIFETVLLALMLYIWKNARWYRATAIMLVAIYVFCWFYYIFALGIDSFSGVSNTVKSIFMMILLAGVLIDISFDDRIPVYKNYKFWISASLLFYFSIGVVLWSTAFLPIGDNVVQSYSWNIHVFISIFTNLMITYGLITFVRWKAIYV